MYFSKSVLLLLFSVLLCCIIYPIALWIVGQVFFPFQANGSLVLGPEGKPIGSKLIAQSFTKDAYFQPRPSAAAYNAAASSSSALAPSNYALRDRVARSIGAVATYASGPNAGKSVAPAIEEWFKKDQFQGKPHIIAQWTASHNALAQAWVSADPSQRPNIPSTFFDMWLQDHPNVELTLVPGDMVTTSASGLDPHISLENANFQLNRVVSQWASHLKRDSTSIKREIEQILTKNAQAPLGGLAGEKVVNVLEVNLELRKLYGAPP